MVLKIVRQGQYLVTRGEDGRVVRRDDAKMLKALVPSNTRNRETWRKALDRITDGGRVLDEVLLNLAMGTPYEPVLPDGRKGEPVVPTPEVRRAAAVDLMHMLRGKPVAQTEVVKSEKEAEDLEQYRAMSDADLEKVIQGQYKLLPHDADATEGNDE